MEDISRDVFKGVGPNGIDVRVYSRDEIDLPSVTTVLKTRDDDKSGLYTWQDRNDGEGNNAYHEHLFWNSRHRGTLCHWHALSSIGEGADSPASSTPEQGSAVEVPWSADEAGSRWAVANIDQLNDDEWFEVQPRGAKTCRLGEPSLDEPFEIRGDDHTEVHDAAPRDVLYSVLRNKNAVQTWGDFYDKYGPYNSHQHYSLGLLDVLDNDIEFFTDAFDRIRTKLGVSEEDVIAAEQFLFDEEYGYAGQVDLVYEDLKGNVVVADLKTSSGCYEKHKLQGAAYGHAVERALGVEVDRLEVWRIHPDSGQYAVHSHDASVSGLHTDEYWYKDFDTLWEEFRDLATNFDYEHDE
jgi:hypothetical protein